MTRSMTVHALRFHRKRKTDVPINPHNLNGESLFELMRAFGHNCGFDTTRDETSHRMIKVNEFSPLSNRECLIKVTQASWGESSDVLDPNDFNTVAHHIDERDPVASPSRALCIAPPVGNKALYFSEYTDRSSASYFFLSLFKSNFVHAIPDITLDVKREFTEEEWLETARVSSLTIETRRKAANLDDGTTRFVGKLRFSITPDNRFGWADRLKSLTIDPLWKHNAGLIDIAEDLGFSVGKDDEVSGKATLVGLDGKRTTVSIDEGIRAPFIREVIQTPSGGALSDDDFVTRCRDRATILFNRD